MINGIIQKNSTKNVRIFPGVGDLKEKKITGPERKMNMVVNTYLLFQLASRRGNRNGQEVWVR